MYSKEWVQHLPVFESDRLNPEMMIYSPWSGHRLFAYDFIVKEKPECIVELGSFYGCSSFAFLQAIKDCHLHSEFYAIDTWAGDGFTENDYKEDIYGQYKRIQDHCFYNQNAHMLRMTFDDAVERFEDQSIDLLHIDGSHLFEDIRHDFTTWKCKVRKSGVILFHDVGSDLLEGKPLGSHLFWEGLKKEYPFTLEFPFSFGLGVLFFDKEKYKLYKTIIDFEYYQRQANFAAVQYKDKIRKQYFQVQSLKKYNESLKQQVAVCQEHLERYSQDVKMKDSYISELEENNNALTINCEKEQNEVLRLCDEQVQIIGAYKTTIAGKDNYITDLEGEVSDLTEKVHALMDDITHINTEYEENLEKYKKTEEGKDLYITDLKESISKYENTVFDKDNYIAELGQTIKKYETAVKGKENYISELLETISKYRETVDVKEIYIQELLRDQEQKESKLRELLEEVDRQEAIVNEEAKRRLQLTQQYDADQKKIALLEMQIEEHRLVIELKKKQLETINKTLKNAMLNAQKDQELIIGLQKKLGISENTIGELEKALEKFPFGQMILKRMR